MKNHYFGLTCYYKVLKLIWKDIAEYDSYKIKAEDFHLKDKQKSRKNIYLLNSKQLYYYKKVQFINNYKGCAKAPLIKTLSNIEPNYNETRYP